MKRPPTHTQKLLFDAKMWKPATIRAWIGSHAASHRFTARKIELLRDDYHVRQRDPKDFITGSFSTIPFGDVKKTGIQAVIGHIKGEEFRQRRHIRAVAAKHTYRFDRDPRTDGTIRHIMASNPDLDEEIIDRIAALGIGRSFTLDLGAGGKTRIERVR